MLKLFFCILVFCGYSALVLPRLLLLSHPLLLLLLPPLGALEMLALQVRERRRLLVPEEAVAAIRAPGGGVGGRGGGPADGHSDGRGGGGVAAVGRAEGRRRWRRVRGSAVVGREDHGEVHLVADGLLPPLLPSLLLFLLLLLLLVFLLRDDASPVLHVVSGKLSLLPYKTSSPSSLSTEMRLQSARSLSPPSSHSSLLSYFQIGPGGRICLDSPHLLPYPILPPLPSFLPPPNLSPSPSFYPLPLWDHQCTRFTLREGVGPKAVVIR